MKTRHARIIRQGILFARQDFFSDDEELTGHPVNFSSWRDGHLYTNAYFVTTYRLIDDAVLTGKYNSV